MRTAFSLRPRKDLTFTYCRAQTVGHNPSPVVETAKALAVFVGLVAVHAPLEYISRQGFHSFLKSAYPAHVAVLVIEFALQSLPHAAMDCNTFSVSSKIIPDSSERRPESSTLIQNLFCFGKNHKTEKISTSLTRHPTAPQRNLPCHHAVSTEQRCAPWELAATPPANP